MAKTSKATAIMRPKSWKKFAIRDKTKKKGEDEDANMEPEPTQSEEENDSGLVDYVPLVMRTQYVLDKSKKEEAKDDTPANEQADSETEDEDEPPAKKDPSTIIEKEELIRGYKYGSSFVPTPEPFARLPTRKGIDICGFFRKKQFRRDWPMGEVQYIWADPDSPLQQVALSSIVQAMYTPGIMAIARWVSRDGMDPKMGVLEPTVFDEVDCFLWVPVCNTISL